MATGQPGSNRRPHGIHLQFCLLFLVLRRRSPARTTSLAVLCRRDSTWWRMKVAKWARRSRSDLTDQKTCGHRLTPYTMARELWVMRLQTIRVTRLVLRVQRTPLKPVFPLSEEQVTGRSIVTRLGSCARQPDQRVTPRFTPCSRHDLWVSTLKHAETVHRCSANDLGCMLDHHALSPSTTSAK